MEYIIELFDYFFYSWLGRQVFGESFVENRKSIPLWKRLLLGSLCILISCSLILGIYSFFRKFLIHS